MKLGDIVAGKAGGAFSAPTKPVKFKVLGKNGQGEQTIADAEALIAFVPDDDREEALIQSEKAIRKQFPDGIVSPDRLEDSHTYHVLVLALRDASDPRVQFASDVSQLKAAMQRREALYLWGQYLQFVADEFPERIDDETFEQLVEDAKKKSFADLLSQYGSSTIRLALPSLATAFSESTTPTSGDGEPG